VRKPTPKADFGWDSLTHFFKIIIRKAEEDETVIIDSPAG
jgi:hypothetical protein